MWAKKRRGATKRPLPSPNKTTQATPPAAAARQNPAARHAAEAASAGCSRRSNNRNGMAAKTPTDDSFVARAAPVRAPSQMAPGCRSPRRIASTKTATASMLKADAVASTLPTRA